MNKTHPIIPPNKDFSETDDNMQEPMSIHAEDGRTPDNMRRQKHFNRSNNHSAVRYPAKRGATPESVASRVITKKPRRERSRSPEGRRRRHSAKWTTKKRRSRSRSPRRSRKSRQQRSRRRDDYDTSSTSSSDSRYSNCTTALKSKALRTSKQIPQQTVYNNQLPNNDMRHSLPKNTLVANYINNIETGNNQSNNKSDCIMSHAQTLPQPEYKKPLRGLLPFPDAIEDRLATTKRSRAPNQDFVANNLQHRVNPTTPTKTQQPKIARQHSVAFNLDITQAKQWKVGEIVHWLYTIESAPLVTYLKNNNINTGRRLLKMSPEEINKMFKSTPIPHKNDSSTNDTWKSEFTSKLEELRKAVEINKATTSTPVKSNDAENQVDLTTDEQQVSTTKTLPTTTTDPELVKQPTQPLLTTTPELVKQPTQPLTTTTPELAIQPTLPASTVTLDLNHPTTLPRFVYTTHGSSQTTNPHGNDKSVQTTTPYVRPVVFREKSCQATTLVPIGKILHNKTPLCIPPKNPADGEEVFGAVNRNNNTSSSSANNNTFFIPIPNDRTMLEPLEISNNSTTDDIKLPEITDQTKMFYSMIQTLRPDHASIRQISMLCNILDDQMKGGKFAYNDIEQLELVKNNFFKFRHDSTYRDDPYASAYAFNRLGSIDGNNELLISANNGEILPKLTTKRTTAMLAGKANTDIQNAGQTTDQITNHTANQTTDQTTETTATTTRAITRANSRAISRDDSILDTTAESNTNDMN